MAFRAVDAVMVPVPELGGVRKGGVRCNFDLVQQLRAHCPLCVSKNQSMNSLDY